MNQKNWFSLLKEYRVLVGIIVVGLFLIEFEIFSFAAMSSGKQPRLQIISKTGKVVYEIKGSTLANFDKARFEKTFGPFENYQVKLTEKYIPFPFRAWFSAAIGVPIGLVLLLAFILKAVMFFIYGGEESRDSSKGLNQKHKNGQNNTYYNQTESDENKTAVGVEKLLLRISRFNIFIIGFLVICLVFLLWVIPNTLTFLAETSLKTIVQFKWFFLGGFIAIFILFAWFLYMKYKLAKKMIDAETEIKKYELRLEYAGHGKNTVPLDHKKNQTVKMINFSDQCHEISDTDTDKYHEINSTDADKYHDKTHDTENNTKKFQNRNNNNNTNNPDNTDNPNDKENS